MLVCRRSPGDGTRRWSSTGSKFRFRFEIAGERDDREGIVLQRRTSESPRPRDASRTACCNLSFDQYAARLEAAERDGSLTGEYRRGTRAPYPFNAPAARRDTPAAPADAPSIDGTWIVGAKSNKGETAWRFIVQQTGAQVSATILRVDGDTGTLSGGYRDGRFVLSHFSGARPLLLEVTPLADGTLTLRQNAKTELVAVRAETARAKEIGEPTDPARPHECEGSRSEPFRFSFPDLDGKVVSNDRSRSFAARSCSSTSAAAGARTATTKHRFWPRCTGGTAAKASKS